MCKVDSLILFFGRVGSSWGHCAFFGSSWGEKVITKKKKKNIISHNPKLKLVLNYNVLKIGLLPNHRTFGLKGSNIRPRIQTFGHGGRTWIQILSSSLELETS
jgi:hypothetical protein